MFRRELNPTECHTMIYEGRGFNHQCSKKPVVTRDGKLYCKIHDPEYIKKKCEKWQAKFDEDWAKKEQRWALEKARKQAIEGLTLEELRRVTPDLIRKALANK